MLFGSIDAQLATSIQKFYLRVFPAGETNKPKQPWYVGWFV
jgi:hypothetical protein